MANFNFNKGHSYTKEDFKNPRVVHSIIKEIPGLNLKSISERVNKLKNRLNLGVKSFWGEWIETPPLSIKKAIILPKKNNEILIQFIEQEFSKKIKQLTLIIEFFSYTYLSVNKFIIHLIQYFIYFKNAVLYYIKCFIRFLYAYIFSIGGLSIIVFATILFNKIYNRRLGIDSMVKSYLLDEDLQYSLTEEDTFNAIMGGKAIIQDRLSNVLDEIFPLLATKTGDMSSALKTALSNSREFQINTSWILFNIKMRSPMFFPKGRYNYGAIARKFIQRVDNLSSQFLKIQENFIVGEYTGVEKVLVLYLDMFINSIVLSRYYQLSVGKLRSLKYLSQKYAQEKYYLDSIIQFMTVRPIIAKIFYIPIKILIFICQLILEIKMAPLELATLKNLTIKYSDFDDEMFLFTLATYLYDALIHKKLDCQLFSVADLFGTDFAA